jgi:AcrR family transcriptional regulator
MSVHSTGKSAPARRKSAALPAKNEPPPAVTKKQEILREALGLFSAHGFEGTGVAEIVAVCGITKPTLYYYFESKEKLFSVILEENFSALNEALKSAAHYIPNPKRYNADVFPVL